MINREVIYERNMTGSYMKIPEGMNDGLDERLMLKGKLRGTLPVEKAYVDGGGQYWYNISGKQSLDTYCRMKQIGIEFVERLIVSICSELEILEWNLIHTNCLMLDPELVFITNSNREFIFTLYPGNNTQIELEFQQLMEYLLTRIDHKDEAAVRTVYGIYEKTLEESYSLTDIRDLITETRSRESGRPEEESRPLFQPEVRPQVQAGNHEREPQTGSYERESQAGSYGRTSQAGSCEREPQAGSYGRKPQPGGYGRTSQPERSERDSGNDVGLRGNFLRSAQQPKHESKRKNGEKGVVGAGQRESPCNGKTKEGEAFVGKIRNFLKNFRERIEETLAKVKKKEGEPVVVYPEEEISVPQEEIFPTVCLNGFRGAPRGVLLYQGAERLEDIRLESKVVWIGHGPEADARIVRDTISQLHARIDRDGDHYYIEDLNSTNGTCVNDETLVYKERRLLKINDIVQFADIRYRFC